MERKKLTAIASALLIASISNVQTAMAADDDSASTTPKAPTLSAAKLAQQAEWVKEIQKLASAQKTKAEQALVSSLAIVDHLKTEIEQDEAKITQIDSIKQAIAAPAITQSVDYSRQIRQVKDFDTSYLTTTIPQLKAIADIAAASTLAVVANPGTDTNAAGRNFMESYLWYWKFNDAYTKSTTLQQQINTYLTNNAQAIAGADAIAAFQPTLALADKAATEAKKTLTEKVKQNKASATALLTEVQKASDYNTKMDKLITELDADKKVKDLNAKALTAAIDENRQGTLAANLMALGALDGVQEVKRSSEASSSAFASALNDSKHELSAAIQASSHSLSRRIDDNRKKAAAGIAGVAAMTNIPIPYADGAFTIGVGVGYYDSQSAGAIGFGKGFDNGLAIKASASFATDSNVAIGGGASWSF
ncbi:YadA C-terminal domain-containing protein [Edwardsiella hoshinae]|uniref:YadA-like C-terminal region n=1 Tax=Edwardsiella hoshinae TaxID=93378 RepID=A0A376DDX7_9GAMM|nr:YadA C-terminal domain-containing protein [Edwardsiella hoshinae]QPR27278.1 YadA C-terminal domain-containing protein [Edwardsiella hoshinae]STC87904.1 YadA-like C-terminal region [Edwardsiella hoshinae]